MPTLPTILASQSRCRSNAFRQAITLSALLLTTAIFAWALPSCSESAHQAPVAGSATINDDQPIAPADADWPWWRGHHLDGKAPASTTPPLQWSDSQNIAWQVNVRGQGHASPIIWGDQVFTATASTASNDGDSSTQSLLCHDLNDGTKRWETQIHQGEPIDMHSKNSHASATPACDGTHVYTVFAIDEALHVTALNLKGDIVWQERVDDFDSQHGFGSSPVLYRSTVIVLSDHNSASHLIALDRKTGQRVWTTERPDYASYATPIVAKVAGKMQLLVHGNNTVTSYNPDTGELIWQCEGPSNTAANTLGFDGQNVYASGGYPQRNLICIRADGSGDVSDTHVAWRDSMRAAVSYVTSPVVHDGMLFVVSDQGRATCYDTATGKVKWRQTLRDQFSASPVLVGDNLFVSSERGHTYIIKAADTYELIGKNTLPSGHMATPAFSGNRIILRTENKLYCMKAGSN